MQVQRIESGWYLLYNPFHRMHRPKIDFHICIKGKLHCMLYSAMVIRSHAHACTDHTHTDGKLNWRRNENKNSRAQAVEWVRQTDKDRDRIEHERKLDRDEMQWQAKAFAFVWYSVVLKCTKRWKCTQKKNISHIHVHWWTVVNNNSCNTQLHNKYKYPRYQCTVCSKSCWTSC